MTRRDAGAGSGDHRSIALYLRRHGIHVVTAESCTAGLIASRIAEVPGCGDVLYCSIVAYSPSAKEQLLRVPVTGMEHDRGVGESRSRYAVE